MNRLVRMAVVFGVLLIGNQAAAQSGSMIGELADQWVEAYNLHDTDGLGALYREEAVLMVHGAPVIRGRDAITAFWAEDFKEGNPITILNVTHSVNGVDMMLVHGDYQVIDRESGLNLGLGRFAHIWLMNQAGSWELDRDLWNEPFQPYEQ